MPGSVFEIQMLPCASKGIDERSGTRLSAGLERTS